MGKNFDGGTKGFGFLSFLVPAFNLQPFAYFLYCLTTAYFKTHL